MEGHGGAGASGGRSIEDVVRGALDDCAHVGEVDGDTFECSPLDFTEFVMSLEDGLEQSDIDEGELSEHSRVSARNTCTDASPNNVHSVSRVVEYLSEKGYSVYGSGSPATSP